MSLRPIFYDTETTGISPTNDRIIEIAAFDPYQDKTFEMLVNPDMKIPPEATAIHHISDDMVKDSPSFAEVGEQFIQFCDGDVVLIAHNNDNFDIHFLRNEFNRHSIEMPTWKFFDTLKWSRRYRPDLPKHQLQFLREIYGIESNNAHRALDDVIVLHKIFEHMTDDLTIDQVYELLNIPRKVTHMPFGKHKGKAFEDIPEDYVKWLESSGAFDKPENANLKEMFQKIGKLPS